MQSKVHELFLCSVLAPALEVSVESSSSTGPSDTVEVLCTANDAEMVEWSVSAASQDFYLDVDSGTVLDTSADNVVSLHQGLSLRSVITSAGSGLNDVESTMTFDSTFPYTGQFSITCTGLTMSSMISVETNVFLEAMNPTMSESGIAT